MLTAEAAGKERAVQRSITLEEQAFDSDVSVMTVYSKYRRGQVATMQKGTTLQRENRKIVEEWKV